MKRLAVIVFACVVCLAGFVSIQADSSSFVTSDEDAVSSFHVPAGCAVVKFKTKSHAKAFYRDMRDALWENWKLERGGENYTKHVAQWEEWEKDLDKDLVAIFDVRYLHSAFKR